MFYKIHKLEDRQHKIRKSSAPVETLLEEEIQQRYGGVETALEQNQRHPGAISPQTVMQLQRLVGNQAVQRLLAQRQTPEEEEIQTKSTAERESSPIPIQTHGEKVAQRRNGATLANWRTDSISAAKGFITHTVGWDSSTGNLADLDDFKTREQVSWNAGCPWAVLEPSYQNAGQHHGIGQGKGDSGSNKDVHQASQPFADVTNLTLGKGKTSPSFVMNQVYQYSSDNGVTWHNIPGSQYILTRTLSRGLLKGNHYTSKLVKKGVQDTTVDESTKTTYKL